MTGSYPPRNRGPRGIPGPAADDESGLKPLLDGLIDRQGGTFTAAANTNTYVGTNGDLRSDAAGQFTDAVQARSLVQGVVIGADWSNLEPTKKNNWDFSWIDNELATAVAAGQTKFSLRIYAGRYMPAWILNANSAALAIPHFYGDQANPANTHFGTAAQSADTAWTGAATAFSGTDFFTSPNSGTSGAMPKWWDPRLADHYYRLMAEVARRYESDSRIRHVQASMVTSYFAEPALHQRQAQNSAGEKMNYVNVPLAGWTEDMEVEAHRNAFEIHDACFATTRTSFPCNPAERYHDTGDAAYTNAIDPEYTKELLRLARAILGNKLIAAQHSIQIPRQGTTSGNGGSNMCWLHTSTSRYTDIFSTIVSTENPRRGFQTQPMSSIGTTPYTASTAAALKATLDDAVSMGGVYVELPTGYNGYLTSSEWTSYDTALKANV